MSGHGNCANASALLRSRKKSDTREDLVDGHRLHHIFFVVKGDISVAKERRVVTIQVLWKEWRRLW